MVFGIGQLLKELRIPYKDISANLEAGATKNNRRFIIIALNLFAIFNYFDSKIAGITK